VNGAHVSITGTLAIGLTSFTMSDEQVVDKNADKNGGVALHLLNGAGIATSYRLAITPPAGSNLGVVFDDKIPSLVGLTTYAAPAPMRLIPRVALRGKVFDVDHHPLTNVAVTARPSLRFLWALDAAPEAFIAALPAATDVTGKDGDYVVWVDPAVPNVSQSWGTYDLMIEPPVGSAAPSFLSEFAIPRGSTLDTIAVPDIALPDPAYVHGRLTGPDGRSVEGAELRLFLISTQLTLCSEVAHAPASCPIPAQLQARNTSDAEGTVRLVLPR